MQNICYYLKKSKLHFIIFSLKKNIIPTIFCMFTLCLIIFSKENLVATKNGLLLWANNIVPSLLPFFIATELLSHTNIINAFSKLLNPIIEPIFHIPGARKLCLFNGTY